MEGFLNPFEVQPGDWVCFRHHDESKGCASMTPALLPPDGDGENNSAARDPRLRQFQQ